MRVFALLVLCACGRIGFDASSRARTDADANVPGGLRYDSVRPVYITGYPLTPLVPTVTGSPRTWSVTPDFPAGITLDPSSGVISGTPATPSVDLYTINADAAQAQVWLRIADGYVVNDSGDGVDVTVGDGICEVATGTGTCTLRAAVGEVNADGGANSVISIGSRTIVLGSLLPPAIHDIELIGDSAVATILDCNNLCQLTQFSADGVTLTLSYLTYRNGLGSLYHNFRNNLTLSIDHAILRNNADLVDLNTNATLHIGDSLFEGNTGNLVVFSGTTAIIERSTFANNTANIDGMLYFVFGNDVSISNSTFTGNTGDRSALVINNATAALTNNTFANNISTASFQGGAITQYSGGTSTWLNNLLNGNSGSSQQCSIAGAMTSSGGNLEFPADTDTAPCGFDSAGDPAPADPRLMALAANNGETPTHALAEGSPAIDTGISPCPVTDQRTVLRPQRNGCDIGAFELQ